MSILLGDKVKCTSNLTLFVHVLLPDKDMEKVDDWGTEFFIYLFFLRLIDWWTDINKRTLHYHCLILCQVIILSPPSVFILHFLCSSLILFWNATAFLLCLASILGCLLRVLDEMASGHSTKKIYKIMEKTLCFFPHHEAWSCLFLSTHSNVKVSMHMHARRRTCAQKPMRLLHTSFNT